jgi:hypothetical protein
VTSPDGCHSSMSAEAAGRYLPAIITLDDLAAMIAADTTVAAMKSVSQPPTATTL